jgi:hypothetical protein
MIIKPSRSKAITPKTHPSPGKCIFCMSLPDGQKLTDEHIIPKMLSGTGELLIKDASCLSCNGHANKRYEQKAANADFLVPRVLLDLKRRKAGKGPKLLPPVALGDATEDNAADFIHQLQAEEHPPIFSLLSFPPPGFLVGEDRGSSLTTVSIKMVNMGLAGSRATGVTSQAPMNHTAFLLSLAKMAYCYAVAELGLNACNGNALRDLLLGRRDDVYNFVGDANRDEPLSGRHLHSFYLRRKGNLISVIVHLFASFGCSAYEVVVMPPCRGSENEHNGNASAGAVMLAS